MLTKKAIIAASWFVLLLVCATFCGCARPAAEQSEIEQPPAPDTSEATSAPAQAVQMSELPPPTLEEVQDAVTRIFKDAVVIDDRRQPAFLIGDFNGDISQDLAVVLKPAEGRLSELNQEYPNWIAREPLDEVLPKPVVLARAEPASVNPAAGQTVRFRETDILLAIIHGYGPAGWHDREATQTHLLRDVVGTAMRRLPLKDVAKTYRGTRPFPTIYGDLIQQTLIGQSGFIHFTGGFYGWYDPKNFKREPVAMSPHSGGATMR